MIKYRIKFSKYSSMIFIGHLDIMRYFQKAIRRAELPIAYSTGFSPHQIMSFAAPLGVGLYSNGEYLDVELTKEIPVRKMIEDLNRVMVEGIDILSVKILQEDAGNAMASVAAAGYTVTLREGHEPAFIFGEGFEQFMDQPRILFEKTTKKSVKMLDLKEGIYDYRVISDGAKKAIYLLVDASSSGNIKPGMIMDAYYRFLGAVSGEFDFIVTREETYGRSKAGELIPLADFGKDN